MRINPTTILLFFLAIGFGVSACAPAKQPTALNEQEQKAYLTRGQTLAQTSFAALSSRLMAAIETGGIPHAVTYCNTAALPLIDSLSKQHKASIRRTSLKVRNPMDAPQDWEKEVLLSYQQQLAEGKRPAPIVKMLDKKRVAFASPIFMAQPCLKCHGVLGQTLSSDNYQVVKQLYPKDQAIGYVDGDWRGMWSITFVRN
ncbi:Tll0287-like domain-containing protein [Haliscomenobacter hydrossis]|uniref:Tll0287-like domain-containing protein n=1 Tax=Haliscomenobacter hydrossis (strain ATCC 27775 / DSM 1100 / LMG 10767 / O) TaxID=760192 RepID=F4KTG6_HALH1|nr:DUF3365 domain-containing protein [Haliscomenobacter hydrossis]AEE52380.1 hypothetical protein Halhy_4540 [Haliscomenobacter hydrossis DSM 1100]